MANWATGISAGPPNESSQTVTFHVSNNNSSLFSAPPAISSNGTLTYTPATNANGSATVTVYLQDNGGTANGGSDTSASQTFTITVTPVNQPPTLNTIGNVTVNENSGLQTVNLGGISVGPTNEVGQTLTVTATSSNPSLIPDPTVNYTSPDATGPLTFTPVTNEFGTATITVVVHDNGGTANGGVDSVTNTFTVTVNMVNHQPTLNAISNLNLVENWSLQTVNLFGITPGPTNESSQTLTIAAISDNPSLVPNPMVNYTNPSMTGSLTFTPATNSFGTATITVVVQDNGGTANGGIDSFTNTFAVTLQGMTNYWYGGSNLTVNIFDATGGPGAGYSQTNYLGVLDVPATSTNPFTIHLASFNGGSPGPAANFNNNSNYTWTIATTTRGVMGPDHQSVHRGHQRVHQRPRGRSFHRGLVGGRQIRERDLCAQSRPRGQSRQLHPELGNLLADPGHQFAGQCHRSRWRPGGAGDDWRQHERLRGWDSWQVRCHRSHG